MTTKLDIIIRTLGPLHITSPEDARVDINGRRRYGKDGFPCSLMQAQRIPLKAEQTEEGRHINVPVIQSNTLRGKLRRMSAEAITEHLRANGEALSLAAWNGLRCGAIFGHPDGDLPSMTEMREDYESVYLGAWGGSPRLTESNISIGNAYPITDKMIEIGMIAEEFGEDCVTPPLTQVVFTRRVDDVIEAINPQVGKDIVQFEQSYTDWIQVFGPAAKAAILQASEEDEEQNPEKGAKGKKKEEAKIQGVKSFTAREVVLPNTSFYAFAECRGEQKHVGMLVESLRRWAENGWIGGGKRIGMGSVHVDVKYRGVSIFEVFDGKVSLSEDDALADIREAHQEAMGEIAKLTAGDIEKLFRAREKTKKSASKHLKGPALEAFRRIYG